MKNIFLTGNVNIGKSTIINKALIGYKGLLGGFRTVPYFLNDRKIYVLESINPIFQEQGLHFICKHSEDGKQIGIPGTFEEYGVEILKHSLEEKADLIIMDELGVFESEAFNFQKCVFSVLESSIPVLGVLKARSTPFLDEIRNRRDVMIIPVNSANRDYLAVKLKEFLSEDGTVKIPGAIKMEK